MCDSDVNDQQKMKSTIMLKSLAFGCVMLASSALNNLFVTYHLDFYLTVVGLQSNYFYGAQIVFMAWNSTNDVLFGWLSDTMPVVRGVRSRRLLAIRWGGFLWALAFLGAWFPWGTSPVLIGINFTLNLCLYGMDSRHLA